MRKSKLSQSIIAILKKSPHECYSITGIAEELGKTIDRKSPGRVSICRCLNRMYRERIVDYEYNDLFPESVKKYPNLAGRMPNKHAGKYWKLKA